MPIYEYQCRKCKHRFEKIMQFSDRPLKNCPDCKAKNTLEQLISAPAIQFKGEGWYVTDYAKKGAGDKPEKSSEPKKEETKSADTESTPKAEDKPKETKTDSKKSESKKSKK